MTDGWAKEATRHFLDKTVVAVGPPPGIPASGTTWIQRAWSFLNRKAATEPVDVSWIASANLWVRKTSFDQIGGFDESLETCEDADLGYRLHERGRLVSDPQVYVAHHREPRTLREFYKKEVWHGKNSFSGIARGRFSLAELPSLLVPLQFGASIAVVLAGIFLTGYAAGKWLLLLGLTGVVAAPVLYTLRMCAKGNWQKSPQYLLIYFVYFLARLDSLLRWLYRQVRAGSH